MSIHSIAYEYNNQDIELTITVRGKSLYMVPVEVTGFPSPSEP